jgi:hypothetical protein
LVINSDYYKKENGERYKSPTGFYRKLGFEILSGIILKTDKININKIRWSKTGYNNCYGKAQFYDEQNN